MADFPSFKEELRALLCPDHSGLAAAAGRMAEALRRDPRYRAAAAVYAEPHPGLRQVRINALVDGKNLLMPTAGLKEGFVLIRPHRIPFPRLGFAVSMKGQLEYGEKVRVERLAGLGVGLLAAAGGMVTPSGLWLGDGKGFFDLSCAILAEARALAADFFLMAAPAACLLAEFPAAPWDLRLDAQLAPGGVRDFPAEGGGRAREKEILWQALAPRRIRKVSPLWQMRQERGRAEHP